MLKLNLSFRRSLNYQTELKTKGRGFYQTSTIISGGVVGFSQEDFSKLHWLHKKFLSLIIISIAQLYFPVIDRPEHFVVVPRICTPSTHN